MSALTRSPVRFLKLSNSKKKKLFLGLCFALPMLIQAASSYVITGRVVHVADGDTITILDVGKTQHKIRLADIDAPEDGQPYGNRAKQRLNQLTRDKWVTAYCREKDKYGRDVCTVVVDGVDANADLVASGHAWVYEQYNQRADLPALQVAAQRARRGLWQLPEAQIVPPSDWRRGQRKVQAQITAAKTHQAERTDATCGSKRYCKQMKDCAEAKYHLLQCGIKSLDRDSDGVPCKSICR